MDTICYDILGILILLIVLYGAVSYMRKSSADRELEDAADAWRVMNSEIQELRKELFD